MITLYDYYRSTAAYRVRIALHLKGIAHKHKEIHLVDDGGQQHSAAYRQVNPQGLVPSIQLADGTIITQSLSILTYLESIAPSPALWPTDIIERTRVESFAYAIACDIHPLNNLRVLQYLQGSMGATDEGKKAWYAHWIAIGFAALEAQLGDSGGQYCFGDAVTLADICLIPQVYNALRFSCPMDDYPTINAIYGHCTQLAAFVAAAPHS